MPSTQRTAFARFKSVLPSSRFRTISVSTKPICQEVTHMLSVNLSIVLGISFVLVGALNVWLMFHASSVLKDKGAHSRLVTAHRLGGYIFTLIFIVMTYFMVIRMKEMPGEESLRPLLHMTLAMLLVPLLFAKVLIARYYKAYYSVLMPLGLVVFTIAFLLVGVTLGPYLIHRATMKEISLESINMGSMTIDLDQADALMKRRCTGCHNLDRVLTARKDAPGWLESVNRMRALPGANISEQEAITIVSYLVAQIGIDGTTREGAMVLGRALVNSHCGRCHGLDRTYNVFKSPDEWQETVERMVVYAPENFFKEGEQERVVQFLSSTQTPEAENARKEQKQREALAIRTKKVQPAATRSSVMPAIGGAAVALVAAGYLLLRRPKVQVSVQEESVPASGKEVRRRAMTLRLARIERQTDEACSLRFVLPAGEEMHFKPGQFLTFNFDVDGKRVIRSYSISSSPTQSGYIEITPKRIPNGLVSSYLTTRAEVGLTVEAKGPSGQFYFDERRHGKLVFITAGSGITPVMSILRYVDDRCLSNEIVLFHSTRYRRNILFMRDLEAMNTRVQNLRIVATVTGDDPDWNGLRGRITREMIAEYLGDIAGATFFICGPKAFMQKAYEILSSLGVDRARILQESFGGSPVVFTAALPQDMLAASESTAPIVEFVRSGKSCEIRKGCSLLETAEINGVAIPSSCRQGQCGTCATRLISGDVEMDVQDGLDDDLKAEGYVLTCVGRAKGNVKLDA